jgi:hypothetical protein
MKRTLTLLAPLAATALLAAGAANAAIITQSNFTAGATTAGTSLGGGVTLNWSILPAGSTFQKKSGGGYTGVGISGRTAGEIDIGEYLNATAVGGAFTIDRFVLGLLFDGPEFGDFQEVAQVTATLAGGGTIVGTLTNTYQGAGTDVAVWSLPGANVTNLSPSVNGSGAVWKVDNPFGSSALTAISFTAIAGTCGRGLTCSNQSDYTLVKLVANPVPEPATFGLLGAALLGVGAAARARRR